MLRSNILFVAFAILGFVWARSPIDAPSPLEGNKKRLVAEADGSQRLARDRFQAPCSGSATTCGPNPIHPGPPEGNGRRRKRQAPQAEVGSLAARNNGAENSQLEGRDIGANKKRLIAEADGSQLLARDRSQDPCSGSARTCRPNPVLPGPPEGNGRRRKRQAPQAELGSLAARNNEAENSQLDGRDIKAKDSHLGIRTSQDDRVLNAH